LEEALVAKNARYCAQFRRRREGKTDYRARRSLIVSGKPRLAVRTSMSNITAQVLVARPHGDEVLVSAHSRELTGKYGWKAPRGNLSAAYLTGFLCGQKAKAQGVEEAILDIGLKSPTAGARVFAVLKGVLDAGVEMPHGEEKLPSEKSIEGEHVAKYAASLASDPEAYQRKFSRYLEHKLPPEKITSHFAEVKSGIVAAFKSGGKKK
jgi:large subunit ribosomal protein L18